MAERIVSEADIKVRNCIETSRSFALIAGAGAGKTSSLIDALDLVRTKSGANLRQNGQRIACITYTKRAVEVIKSRLGFDDLFVISTLHSFFWSEISRFQHDIHEVLREKRIPDLIVKAEEKDNGGNSQEARDARRKAAELKEQCKLLSDVPLFVYEDTTYSDYGNGTLGHDDIVAIASYFMADKEPFRRILGLRYPYLFVDEAQDTANGIISGINITCKGDGLPLVGYFGDPWQQIYEGRAGEFQPPPQGEIIPKLENFRCSLSVISLLNAFRNDVEQYAAGDNAKRIGSVIIRLVQAENPEGERKRYSDPQIERALKRMDQSLSDWGWSRDTSVMQLFLARQMIARRLGFSQTNSLFTGKFASHRGQQDYESGEHFLLQPFINVIWPIIRAFERGNERQLIEVLEANAPAFMSDGPNKDRPLGEMIRYSKSVLSDLIKCWRDGSTKDVLNFCHSRNLLRMSDRLQHHLNRAPRSETYNEEVHSEDKTDWLCDMLFTMNTSELRAYCEFIANNTVYSTQHGVKGEEYKKVLVVFDDVEAAWTQYSFTKLLTPQTSGAPTEGQNSRSRKLAYVCFSRATEDLRILLFTPNPTSARQELIDRKLVSDSQIEILSW